MNRELHQTEWDYCVVGNGVSALWISHWLWSTKKSVLWITSDDPYSPERALLQHAWLWGAQTSNTASLVEQIRGFESDESLNPLEVAYFDARSSKRFRRFGEAKQEWGTHEAPFFNALAAKLGAEQPPMDLWPWHSRVHAFHDSGQAKTSFGPTQIELFSEPRFVRVQGWPVVELKTEDNQISGVVLAGLKPTTESIEITAEKFFLGDFDEFLPSLIKTPEDSERLAAVLKRRSYRAGFGLRLWHRELPSALASNQVVIVPMVVNPAEKSEASHLVGRFIHRPGSLESFWVSFLTDEELEDNNEILKKIKQAKRAVERAIPGFIASVVREAVTFEQKMGAVDLVKGRKVTEALGATLISDYDGADAAAEAIGVRKNDNDKTRSHPHVRTT